MSDHIFVKAGRGKTAHPVWAADGGACRGARLLRPDTDESGDKPLEGRAPALVAVTNEGILRLAGLDAEKLRELL